MSGGIYAEESFIVIESINVGVPLETRLPEGVASLNTPEKAVITYTFAGKGHTAEIAISYTQKNYSPRKGKYTLSIESVQPPYRLPEEIAGTAAIKVQVTDVTCGKAGDVYSFTNACVAISAKGREDYRITDMAGLYTYYDNVSVIDAMDISGESPRLVIKTPLVSIKGDITFRDIRWNAEAEVAEALVTKIRTECPRNVIVNGISLGSFKGKTVTEITGSGTGGRNVFFFNGIPGIIARGEDGGTYAYRSYDRKKLSETALMGWIVSGGSHGADSIIAASNVRFESGTVYQLFGGGEGVTADACMVLGGGAVADASFGGAMRGGTVGRAEVVYESGDSKRRAYVGGEGAILGNPDKCYGEGEYSAEVWLFGCAIQYINLGGRDGDMLYGNIRFEQYGGSLLNLYTGGTKEGHHYGSADITVYGGMWEKAFEQQALQEGDAILSLYEGIHRKEFIEYPIFEKKNDPKYKLEVKYFSCADDFRFTEYADHREEIVDTSRDKGKLVVRFLETRVADGFRKGAVKIRDGTGDCIFITFPNGQNMLIDTGREKGGEYIIQDLKDLGVTKLDYVMITHEHTDHMGALRAICHVFGVDTFLYQKYIDTAQELRDAAASKGAKVIYLGAGDMLLMGEVCFRVISPEKEILAETVDANIGSIAGVMVYGGSKALFTGDALVENEESWLAGEETRELISGCQLLKLGHHGIFNANSPEFLSAVHADKYVITQMREYGTQLGQAAAQLQGVLGVEWNDIYVTGRHGMIKAVFEKDGSVDMSCQYRERRN